MILNPRSLRFPCFQGNGPQKIWDDGRNLADDAKKCSHSYIRIGGYIKGTFSGAPLLKDWRMKFPTFFSLPQHLYLGVSQQNKHRETVFNHTSWWHWQDLIFKYDPSVVKIDAEGAERFLLGVEDFKSVRRLVVEWDWTHNKEQKCWDEAGSGQSAYLSVICFVELLFGILMAIS